MRSAPPATNDYGYDPEPGTDGVLFGGLISSTSILIPLLIGVFIWYFCLAPERPMPTADGFQRLRQSPPVDPTSLDQDDDIESVPGDPGDPPSKGTVAPQRTNSTQAEQSSQLGGSGFMAGMLGGMLIDDMMHDEEELHEFDDYGDEDDFACDY